MARIVIGRVNNPRAAQAFCDYMRSQQINVWQEQIEDQIHLVMDDENQEDFACAELRSFLTNPTDPKYLDASWNQGSAEYHSPLGSRGSSGGFVRFWQRSGPLTRILVLISVLVSIVTMFGANMEVTRWLTIADVSQYRGGLDEILSGQIWRLVTPIFLHFMLLHILFNMMWLWDLGGDIERNQSSQFLGFFVVSVGIMSNIVQYVSSGPAFGGMSGVVYGLLGYIWIRAQKPGSGYHLNPAVVTLMLIWLIMGYTGILGPIGNAAHLSGLLLGVAYGFGWNLYE